MDNKKLLCWARAKSAVREATKSRDRWINWDGVYGDPDDPWCMVEEAERERKRLEFNAENVASRRAAAVENMIARPIDISAMSECEYSDMYKLPPRAGRMRNDQPNC